MSPPMAESDAMNIDAVMERIRPCYDRHVPGENIEVEFRFGKFNGSFFDTNVGAATFRKVYEGLQQFLGWEKVVNTVQDVYYADAENVRMSVDGTTEERSLIRKSKVEQVDFTGIETSPFDVRFSVNHEEPLQGEFAMDRKRMKQRTSFIRKNLSIDMTVSTGAAFDKDDENPACYQIEMEIVDPSEISCEEELYNIAYKINDVMRILK
tara:strand:+ start:1808 stop:2434 length:627 start_codon:yes stop_codon:yes gene_type:complete